MSPISTVLAACGWSAELSSDAEHIFGIELMGCNKQSSATGWQQVSISTQQQMILQGQSWLMGQGHLARLGEDIGCTLPRQPYTHRDDGALCCHALPDLCQPHLLQTPTAPTGRRPHLCDLQDTESFRVSWLFTQFQSGQG